MEIVIVLLILILLFSGGGYYWSARPGYDGAGMHNVLYVLAAVVLIVLVLRLLGVV